MITPKDLNLSPAARHMMLGIWPREGEPDTAKAAVEELQREGLVQRDVDIGITTIPASYGESVAVPVKSIWRLTDYGVQYREFILRGPR